jgi:hypothetical protein
MLPTDGCHGAAGITVIDSRLRLIRSPVAALASFANPPYSGRAGLPIHAVYDGVVHSAKPDFQSAAPLGLHSVPFLQAQVSIRRLVTTDTYALPRTTLYFVPCWPMDIALPFTACDLHSRAQVVVMQHVACGTSVRSLAGLDAKEPKLRLLVLGHASHGDMARADIRVALPLRGVEYSSVARFKYDDASSNLGDVQGTFTRGQARW